MQIGRERRLTGWSGHPRGTDPPRNTEPTRDTTPGRRAQLSSHITSVLTALGGFIRSHSVIRAPALPTMIQSVREQRESLGAQAMPGITPEELANLLDSGLDPNEISYLCFTRWRYRRGELDEGICLPNQISTRGMVRATHAQLDRTRV